LVVGEVEIRCDMEHDRFKRGALEYYFYSFGKSKTRFRGPRQKIGGDYNVFLGASETFGKFIPKTYPQILEGVLGRTCINFAAHNAGVEMYLRDPSVLLACADARVTVVAVTGAHNISNRFYSVHPRHNDRFVRASDMLKMLYRDVEFTDIHYTRHLLANLRKSDEMKYGLVLTELRAAWTARMKTLLEMIDGKTILLWMSEHVPAQEDEDICGADPLFVDQSMLDQLSPLVTKVVECVVPRPENALVGMVFDEADRAMAENLPGTALHQAAAIALEPVLRHLM